MSVDVFDPPKGANINNGAALDVSKAGIFDEEKSLFDGSSRTAANDSELYFIKSLSGGLAGISYLVHPQPPATYADSTLVATSVESAFVLAHEAVHILTAAGH